VETTTLPAATTSANRGAVGIPVSLCTTQGCVPDPSESRARALIEIGRERDAPRARRGCSAMMAGRSTREKLRRVSQAKRHALPLPPPATYTQATIVGCVFTSISARARARPFPDRHCLLPPASGVATSVIMTWYASTPTTPVPTWTSSGNVQAVASCTPCQLSSSTLLPTNLLSPPHLPLIFAQTLAPPS
jgi:hypothetical protein